MLHILSLIVGGLILTGWLSGIFEQLALRNHYWAVIFAAVCVFASAWTHTWKWLVIGLVVATAYVGLRTDWKRWKERRATANDQTSAHPYANSGSRR
jgi:chromate transport protein ChrA